MPLAKDFLKKINAADLLSRVFILPGRLTRQQQHKKPKLLLDKTLLFYIYRLLIIE